MTEVASHDTRLVGLDSSKARRPKARWREIAETRLIFASSVFGAKFALRQPKGRKAHQTALELRYIQFPRPFRRPTLATAVGRTGMIGVIRVIRSPIHHRIWFGHGWSTGQVSCPVVCILRLMESGAKLFPVYGVPSLGQRLPSEE